MPRGYELTSYYDSLRALHRKIYSKEVKKLSGAIKNFALLNQNLYGLAISSVNNGLEDNLGKFTKYLHHISSEDIGVNQNSRLQDFMSPLELRANTMAVKEAIIAISNLSSNATVYDLQRECYLAGQSVGLLFQELKECKRGEFSMQIPSPVLSTTPIIKKYDNALKQGTYPKGESIVYTNSKLQQREELILANKKAFQYVKEQLTRIGIYGKSQIENAFKMLNMGYYFVDDNYSGILEPSVLLFSNNFDTNVLYVTELVMNLEKLYMLNEMLKNTNPLCNVNALYKKIYSVGEKARNVVISKYKILPEMFSGFYNVYSQSEKVGIVKKQHIDSLKNAKNEIIKQ